MTEAESIQIANNFQYLVGQPINHSGHLIDAVIPKTIHTITIDGNIIHTVVCTCSSLSLSDDDLYWVFLADFCDKNGISFPDI